MPERRVPPVLTQVAARIRAVTKPCLLLGSAAFVVSTANAAPSTRSGLPGSDRPGAAHPSPGTSPDASPDASSATPSRSLKTLQQVSKALREAKTPSEARALERRAETLRQRHLTPATRLLLEKADALLKAHDYRKAEAALASAVVLQPDRAFIRRARARIRYAAGDFEGAISDLGVALQMDADDPLSWRLLSQVEEERHDIGAALSAARQVLVVDPQAHDIRKRITTLQATLDGRPI